MLGCRRGSGARSGLTLVELVIAIAVVGVLGSLVLSRHIAAPTRVAAPTVTEPEVLSCPAPEPAQDELSLQETLDRMGYTVNVPSSFRGHSLAPRGYRQSVRDDSLEADWFLGAGAVSMQLISQQTDLDAATRFVVEEPFGQELTSFEPVVPCGFEETPRPVIWASSLPVRFRLDLPPIDHRSESGYSPAVSASGTAHFMVLPARKNGVWVQEECGTGYWAGAEETGDYLLCWEDRSGNWDGDFQDLVFVARGIKPSVGPVVDPEPQCRGGIAGQ